MDQIIIPALQLELGKKLNEKYNNSILSNQYAWWMLEALTNKKKEYLISEKNGKLTDEQIATLDDWFDKLFNKSMPLQYLLGSVPFLDLELIVEPPILIPRPETEEMVADLVEQLTALKNQKLTILDIGTGSGCIAIALAKALPNAKIFGVDIAEGAIELALRNAKHNNIENVSFIHSDLFTNIPHGLTFDLVISNPPYVTTKEWENLDDSVTQWEDITALVAEKEGTAIIEKIITQTPKFLHENKEMKHLNIPQLILEIGYKQGKIVTHLLEETNYSAITIKKDLEGKDRIVTGRVKHVAIRSKKE